GQGAHDGSAAANIRAIADDNASGDTAFDHGRTKRASVEVDEACVHHGGAFSQVSAEAAAVRVTNAHTGRNHVVNHAWELVHGVDGDWATWGQTGAHHLEISNSARAVVGPHYVRQQDKDTVHVQAMWLYRTVGEQVQTQVCVVSINGRSVQVGDGSLDCDSCYTALFIRTNQVSELLWNFFQAFGASSRNSSV